MTVIGITFLSGCVKEETTEYIFPEMITTSTGQTTDSVIEELSPKGNRDDVVTSIRKGSDDSIIIELTNKQREVWLSDIEEKIQQAKKDMESIGCEITVNNERTEFTYEILGDADIKKVTTNGALVSSRCMQYQIFNGVSPDEIKLQTTIINIKTGKVIVSKGLGEEVTINPEDWDE